MPEFSTQMLDAALAAELPEGFGGKLCVAFSGGLDSSVLLHSLAQLREAHPAWRLRATHIDHQLQAASKEWAAHCQTIAGKLGIECTVHIVNIARDDKRGLEAAARIARYAALRRELEHGEVLLTAHQADDQAETLLLALMRGSGVQGLAAMPRRKPFARGWHVRPLLAFTRQDLELWAHAHRMEGLDDPSNRLRRHDRNFLRHEVAPALRQRWPMFAMSAGRTAHHMGEALKLLDEIAASDLRACAVERCVDIERLQELSASRRRNALRYWLRSRGFQPPSMKKLLGLDRDLKQASPDRSPEVRWRGVDLHWHRGLLYAEPERATFDGAHYRQSWDWHTPLKLPAELGTIALMPAAQGLAASRLPKELILRFRNGGAKIALPGRGHHHTLRNLLQEREVLPWWRDRFPLIYAENTLIAVGDVFFSAELAAQSGEAALRVSWEGAPSWRAASAKNSAQAIERE